MTEVHADPALEREVAKSLGPDLHDMHTHAHEELRAVLRRVNEDMQGQPAEVIHARLTADLPQQVPEVRVGERRVEEFAQAICDGTFVC